MIDTFRVWLRPLGASCRVRIEGKENANWLLARLSRSFVFQTVERSSEVASSSFRTIRVAYRRSLSHSAFETMLRSIPRVRLMNGPE